MSPNPRTFDRRKGREQGELGALLLQADLITERQLHEALAAQRKLHERLASVLVRQGVLTEKFAVGYLGKQLGVPAASLSRQTLDLGLLQLIPLELCEKHMVFPLRIEGGRLVVAMKDPLDAKVLSEIEGQRKVRVAPSVALEVSLRQTMSEAHEALKAGRAKVTPDIHRDLDPLPEPLGVKETARGEIVFPMLAVDGPTRLETLAGARIENRSSEPAAAAPESAVPQKTVLLVDPNLEARAALERLLAEVPGLRVVTASNGREALAAAGQAQLVLVDAALPDGHGLELCRRLRSRFPALPLILLSSKHRGWRFARDAEAALGVTAHLEKPFTASELLVRVGTLLGRPASADPTQKAARKQLQEGMAALLRDALPDARTAFLKGLELDPANDLLHYYAGMTFEKLQQPFEAMDRYEEAVRLNPEFDDALVLLAGLYDRSGFRLKAIETWQRALLTARDERSRAKLMAHVVDLLRVDLEPGKPSRAA